MMVNVCLVINQLVNLENVIVTAPLKQSSVQSVPIITNVVSSNPANGEELSIQHYVIKFVSALLQVGCFRRVLQFSPLIKLTTMI